MTPAAALMHVLAALGGLPVAELKRLEVCVCVARTCVTLTVSPL
jgi:hypothetical protein